MIDSHTGTLAMPVLSCQIVLAEKAAGEYSFMHQSVPRFLVMIPTISPVDKHEGTLIKSGDSGVFGGAGFRVGWIGGPGGAGVGVVLGLITGAVATTLSSGSHRIEIVVDVSGKLIIRFNPAGAKPANPDKAG